MDIKVKLKIDLATGSHSDNLIQLFSIFSFVYSVFVCFIFAHDFWEDFM